MDKSLRNIILIFILAVAFYFIVSPYQNCMRDSSVTAPTLQTMLCQESASW
uniref:Uncharacterized protein n=1 Tax=uncultured Oceanospirillales bacterium HF4000_21D01 TaxID=723624 RepID=E7C8B4_9GAMM|nr:hypothetical protein [uncultured Oceanospirillales bacterium HF4000_21D01]